MDTPFLYPLHETADFLVRYCKLTPHTGTGTIAGDANHPFQIMRQINQARVQQEIASSAETCLATFLSPASGDCLFFLQGEAAGRLSRNFGESLTVEGDSSDGRFSLVCPHYYVKATSAFKEQPQWAIAEPVNDFVSITYGVPRPITRVCATINNFDFEYGNVSPVQKRDGDAEILRVEAAGRTVEFS